MAILGIDIASLVAEAISAAGGLVDGTLIKTRAGGGPDPDNPSRTLASTEDRHTFQGIVEAKALRHPDTGVVDYRSVMLIVGGSVSPPAIPAVNDRAELAGITYQLTNLVSRDPAGAAYEFEVT